MIRRSIPALVAVAIAILSLFSAEPSARADGLTMDQVVSVALKRNRDVIAAKLDIEAAQLDRVAAGIYPNPIFSYTLGNIVLGSGNTQGGMVNPGPFSQPVQSVGISEIIDVWDKRGARIHAANLGVELKRLQVEDALREIVYAVRSAYADVLREQYEHQLAKDVQDRYAETIRLSRARRAAGEISEAELRKIELEGLRYTSATVDAEMQLDIARARLGALMGLPPAESSKLTLSDPGPSRTPLSLAALTQQALDQRPDIRAMKASREFAGASLNQAKREAFPDISLGVTYTHSGFTVSGDNPNSLALTLSLPLPIFDRNQAGIGRADLAVKRAENDAARLALLVQHEVADAVRRDARARALLDAYEGGMLDRAESSLKVAEKSYQAGAISLLELLEAQRTYLEVKADYLKTLNVFHQARVDINHAVGGKN